MTQRKQKDATKSKITSTGSSTDGSTTIDEPSKQQNQQPKTLKFEYEFGGPIGTAITIGILPVIVLSLLHFSDIGYVNLAFVSNIEWNNIHSFWYSIKQNHVLCPSCHTTATTTTTTNDFTTVNVLYQCLIGLLCWFVFQVILERYLPCELIEGTFVQNNPNNGKLLYRINGHLAFWITLLIVTIGWPIYDTNYNVWQLSSFPIEIIYHYYAELAFCGIILCFVLASYLYLNSFTGNKILAVGGNSGNPIYDYWMGRELNPRFGRSTFDWKEFCELRPGLIGWMLLNLSCCKVQYLELGYITPSMYLITLFQGIYVWDALYNERAILTTMDITTDGFGFMLIFGDLVWVPFTYSIQAKYLVKHDPHLSNISILMVIVIYIIGFFIFRCSNSQKDAFRTNPDDPKLAHLQYLQTARGTRLLTSGWWGMARKINYTGDYIMGLSWCMVCGTNSIVPYYYAIYFAILLIHRAARDDHLCQQKYGPDWDKYKQIVPYKFIPGIV